MLNRPKELPLIAFVFAALLALGASASMVRAASLDEGRGTATGKPQPASARTLISLPPSSSDGTEGATQPSGTGTAPSGEMAIRPYNASTGLNLVGNVSASWGPSGVRFQVDHISNTRGSGTSGTLRLELWATSTVPVFGSTVTRFTLGTYTLNPLSAGFQYNNVDSGFVAYTPPPAGCYYVTVALLEFNSGSYTYVDLSTLSGGVPDGTGFDRFSFGGATCSAPASCVRNASTACLLSGRFQVRVTYNSATNGSGNAQIMSFAGARAETDQSAFLWFFDPSNFEMGLKMLNACSLNSHFWVFISGLTNQGWTVNILDTQTGATKTYSNALNHLTSTVADTSALGCP